MNREMERRTGGAGGRNLCVLFNLPISHLLERKQSFNEMYGQHLEGAIIIHSQFVQSNIHQLIPIRSIWNSDKGLQKGC